MSRVVSFRRFSTAVYSWDIRDQCPCLHVFVFRNPCFRTSILEDPYIFLNRWEKHVECLKQAEWKTSSKLQIFKQTNTGELSVHNPVCLLDQCIHKSFPSREHHFYFHRLHRVKHIKKLWLNHFSVALIVRGLLHYRALDTIRACVWQLELYVNSCLPRCWSPHLYVWVSVSPKLLTRNGAQYCGRRSWRWSLLHLRCLDFKR